MPVGKKRASPPTSLRSQRHVQLQGPRSRRAMLPPELDVQFGNANSTFTFPYSTHQNQEENKSRAHEWVDHIKTELDRTAFLKQGFIGDNIRGCVRWLDGRGDGGWLVLFRVVRHDHIAPPPVTVVGSRAVQEVGMSERLPDSGGACAFAPVSCGDSCCPIICARAFGGPR